MGVELYNAHQEKIVWTKEQESCLNYTGNKTLMVKGVAGAGKSLVIQALAKQFLAGYTTDKKNKVAVFTFSNTLNSATKEILKINGEHEDYIMVTTLTSYIKYVYQAIGAPKLKIYTDPLATKLKMAAVQEALDAHKKKQGVHRFHNLDLQFWIDEFEWMKGMNVSVLDKAYYLALPRKGRGGKVRMSVSDRNTAFELFCYYDNIRKAEGMGDWIDQALYIIRNEKRIPDGLKFDHILIDEAQDLSLAQMAAAMMLFRKDMIVAMDMNQRIFDQHWTPKMLGIETTTKKLTKSMRTTRQIDDLAESIRKKNDGILEEDDKAIRAVPEKEGPVPQLVHLEDAASEKKYVTEQIKAYLKQNAKISIGIIASKNAQIKTYASWMTDAGIAHEIIERNSTFSVAKPGVKIVNIYNAKGLEFSRVIIPQFVEGNFPYYYKTDDEEEMQLFLAKCRNLVYVGMTRAQFSLTITYHGTNGSRFIEEMDPLYFEAVGLPSSDPMDERAEDRILWKEARKSASMGFIDWHGNRQDSYENILEFAKMKGKMGDDNFGSQRKKKEDANFFGVPELLSMESGEILTLLLKEKKGLDILYSAMVQNAPALAQLSITTEISQQFYDDFLRYSMDALFQQAKIEEDRVRQFADVLLRKVFKVRNPISIDEHYQRIKTSEVYRNYLSRGFELKSGNVTLFWQWIRYLSELSARHKEGTQFIKLYARFIAHLSYYINQLLPDADVGKKYAERRKRNIEIIQQSIATEVEVADLKKNIRNPIFLIYEEEERKRQEAEALAAKRTAEAALAAAQEETRRKKFADLVKFARIILGYYNLEIEDESDMITAGRLYTEIRDKNIKQERMVSIFPAESADLLERNILPVISNDEVHFRLNEHELLHYVEFAAIYMQGAEEETILQQNGTMFITNQRIHMQAGQKAISIPYESLKKAVIYDVMPEIIEFASSRECYFVRTADTELTYQVMKMILGRWTKIEQDMSSEPMNMQEMSIDFLEKEDLESYLFGIKTMMDFAMPSKLQSDLQGMIRSLEFLDTALKKYPSYKEQSETFFTYYIPEAIKILYAYNEYEKAGLEEQKINPLYEKVAAAVQKLSMAAKQQVIDIYKSAIVDTTARAEALAAILTQDGFVDSEYKMN